jgi:hypothetical protein
MFQPPAYGLGLKASYHLTDTASINGKSFETEKADITQDPNFVGDKDLIKCSVRLLIV